MASESWTNYALRLLQPLNSLSAQEVLSKTPSCCFGSAWVFADHIQCTGLNIQRASSTTRMYVLRKRVAQCTFTDHDGLRRIVKTV